MSRRCRMEQIRAKELLAAVEETVVKDRMQLHKEEIWRPLIWNRLLTGFKIQDLKENFYNDVISLFTTYYIQEEVLCKNVKLAEDPTSVECFIRLLTADLKNTTSIAIIDEKDTENEILAGVLILRLFAKDDYAQVFRRVQIIDGNALKICHNLQSHLHRKCDIFQLFDVDRFLYICNLCIKPEYRHQGFGIELMKCALHVAKSLGSEVLAGIFSNFHLQDIGKKCGLKVMHEVNYVEWRNPENKQLYFCDPGAGNYSCAFMAGRLPEELPPRLIEIPPPPPTPEKLPKETRAQKRANTLK